MRAPGVRVCATPANAPQIAERAAHVDFRALDCYTHGFFPGALAVKPSRLSQWLRASVLLALCSFTAYACGGSKFTAVAGSSGGSNGGGSNEPGGGSSGLSSGDAGTTSKVTCQGPEDCDDADPCTVDQCGADGVCSTAPKCGPTEKCCDGACGQCCDQADCEDGLACTDDVCFAGACSHASDNTKCKADEYCSAANGCRKKEACADATGCDDSDPCTDDTCTATTSLCDHVATDCGSKGVCCPGTGCAECCEDSQCNDKDPCTKDSCSAGKCSNVALCGKDQKCCASADKTSATCGSCCTADNCDDSVGCTKDSCTQGTCGHTADSASCGANSTCDPVKDCQVTAQCAKPADCKPSVCQTAACTGGKCALTGCDANMKCCADGCKGCCSDTDCNNDGISCTTDTCNNGTCSHKADSSLCPAATPTCDPANGGCIQCTMNSQCDDKSDCTEDTCDLTKHTCVNKLGVCAKQGLLCCGSTCAACCNNSDCAGGVVGTQAFGKLCPTPTCETGKCITKTVTCPVGYSCCSYGCCLGAQTN